MTTEPIPTPPDLSHLFPERVSPLAEEIERHTVDWLLTLSEIDTPATRHQVQGRIVGLGVARLFPEASRETLEIAADLLLTCLMFDDLYCENTGAAKPGVQARLSARLLGSLEGANGSDNANGLVRCLDDVLARLARIATPAQDARVRAASAAMIHWQLWETVAGRDLGQLDLADYLVMRRHTVQGWQVMALAAPAAGFELSDAQRGTPNVRRLEMATTNLMGWLNDLTSFRWEQHRGGPNLPALLMARQGQPLMEAFATATRMCHDEAEVLLDLAARQSTASESELRRHAQAMVSITAANCFWHRTVPIYPGREHTSANIAPNRKEMKSP